MVLVIGLAAGLLAARPWQDRWPECSVVVRPGESIQAAIGAAEAGDVICLARGEWTESLVIDKSLTIVGRGIGRTIIEPIGYYASVVEVTDWRGGTVNVKLEELTISRRAGHTGVAIGGAAVAEISDCRISGMLYGIQIIDSAQLVLSGSTVSENKQRGVVLSGSARASISDSRIKANLGAAFLLSGSAEATLLDCEISENPGHGFWLREGSRATLSNCSVSRNSGSGLWLTGQSEAEALRSEMSSNGGQGIKAEDSAVLDLIESRVLSNWHGIELGNEARATIVDSAVSGNKWDGISVRDSARATVLNCVVSANMRGVGLGGAASAQISDCVLENNLRYGIFSWSAGEVAGEDNAFRDNGIDLQGNLAGALRSPLMERRETAITWPDERYASLQEAIDALLPGGTLLVQPGTYTAGLTIGTELSIEAGDGEVILSAKSEALPVLSLVDGAELRLAGATVSGGSTGLSVSAGARVALVDCTVSGNSQGINLSYSASAEVMDCSITENSESGIFVGGAAQATITACSVSNHSGFGIAAANSARITVSNSTVTQSGWDGGIILSDSCEAFLEANMIIGNRGYGVGVLEHPCFLGARWRFRGRISGNSNTLEGNRRGDVCPAELGFLATAEGGEFDLRPSSSP